MNFKKLWLFLGVWLRNLFGYKKSMGLTKGSVFHLRKTRFSS